MQHRAECDVAVIGGGIAGLAAAAHAVSRGASVILLEASGMHGGLVFNIGALDDFPSPQPLSGAALAEHLLAVAKAGGAKAIEDRVRSITPAGRGYMLATAAGAQVVARAVVIATGAQFRKLGVPGEAALAGRGVSQCDWCDAGFFRNQPVAVVGGGDAALQAALHLARTSSEVTVIVRGLDPRARRSYLERAADEPKITFLWETRVVAILGDDGVEGLQLESDDPSTPQQLACKGVFVFAGIVPDTDAVPQVIARDDDGRLQTGTDFETALPGVFAVGAVRSGYRGGLVAAMGEAATASAAACERVMRDG